MPVPAWAVLACWKNAGRTTACNCVTWRHFYHHLCVSSVVYHHLCMYKVSSQLSMQLIALLQNLLSAKNGGHYISRTRTDICDSPVCVAFSGCPFRTVKWCRLKSFFLKDCVFIAQRKVHGFNEAREKHKFGAVVLAFTHGHWPSSMQVT